MNERIPIFCFGVIEVGAGGDGLGMVDLTFEDGNNTDTWSLTLEESKAIRKALKKAERLVRAVENA